MTTNSNQEESEKEKKALRMPKQTNSVPRAFVSGGQDGKLRWYRSAGVAPSE